MTEHTPGICVFSPGLLLTVTIEHGMRGEEVHLHPGGQGYWVARAIERLGEPVTLCATVGGEVGSVLVPLLAAQTGISLVTVDQSAPSSVTVYDRRTGTRDIVARMAPTTIDRHAVDKLYSLTLANAIDHGCCVLAGNRDTGEIPTAYYGRLCDDLATLGVPVFTDLHGPELDLVLAGRQVRLVKVSDEDLQQNGFMPDGSDESVAATLDGLAGRVPHDLVLSRGPDKPAIARLDGAWYRVVVPRLAAVDFRGAGDAMVGAMAVAYARGARGPDLVRFGAAAGAASVTRRGLASLDAELVHALEQHVRVEPAPSSADAAMTAT